MPLSSPYALRWYLMRWHCSVVTAGARKSLEDVVEKTRRSSKWRAHFSDFRAPYLHLTPEQYAATAERNGLRVLRIHAEAKAWNFNSRSAFFAFCSVGLVEWTRRLPQTERPEFINAVLDRYQAVAADRSGEENAFKFYQMDISLRAADSVFPCTSEGNAM